MESCLLPVKEIALSCCSIFQELRCLADSLYIISPTVRLVNTFLKLFSSFFRTDFPVGPPSRRVPYEYTTFPLFCQLHFSIFLNIFCPDNFLTYFAYAYIIYKCRNHRMRSRLWIHYYTEKPLYSHWRQFMPVFAPPPFHSHRGLRC